MDYIIFGIGTSATLVLIGWLLRDWGPRLRDRKPAEDEILSASQMVIRMAWARFCATCGMALVFGGVIVMLVTIVVTFVAPTDRAASIAVLTVFGVAGFLMLIWTALYLRQFGSIGVHRPVEKTVPEPTPAVLEPSAASPAAIGQDVVAPAPEPSFAEAVASRGGLGRFAGFLRRGATDAPVLESTAQPSEVGAGDGDAVVSAAGADAGGEITPTDAVIAELEGAGHDAENKKLSETDPLVTSVRALVAGASDGGSDVEAEVAAEIPGSSADEPVSEDEPLTEGSTEVTSESALAEESASPETVAESPSGDRPDHELALESLRKRRLERLANKSEPE